MNFQIRTARVEDFAAITRIYEEAVLHGTASYELVPPSEQEMITRWKSISEARYPYLVADGPDHRILGYAYASAFRTRPAYRWLAEDSVYLDPSARGQGVGTALLEALIDQCEKSGYRQMIAVVGGASEASIKLHARCGFELAGRLRATGFKHGIWLDTVLMQRPLGPGCTTDPDLVF